MAIIFCHWQIRTKGMLDKVHTQAYDLHMDIYYENNGDVFVWNDKKAASNFSRHGVTFEQATAVFFDPNMRIVNADRNDEARDAVIGYDNVNRLLYVVHVEMDNDVIRVISARKTTKKERKDHDS